MFTLDDDKTIFSRFLLNVPTTNGRIYSEANFDQIPPLFMLFGSDLKYENGIDLGLICGSVDSMSICVSKQDGRTELEVGWHPISGPHGLIVQDMLNKNVALEIAPFGSGHLEPVSFNPSIYHVRDYKLVAFSVFPKRPF